MVNFYNQLTEGTLAILVMIISVALFTGALWIYKRFLPTVKMEPGNGDIAQIYAGAIGTVFALIFAFVIIAVWQNFDHLSNIVAQEANVLNNIYRNLDAYPPAFKDPVQKELQAYVQQVVEVEWPNMSSLGADPLADQGINRLSQQITTYRPPSPGEVPLQDLMIQLVTQNRTLRNDRLRGSAPYLDRSMWVSLDLGCAILLFFSCILAMPSKRQHYLLNGVLGGSMGLVYYLLFIYNYPMQGPGHITPAALQVLQKEVWVVK